MTSRDCRQNALSMSTVSSRPLNLSMSTNWFEARRMLGNSLRMFAVLKAAAVAFLHSTAQRMLRARPGRHPDCGCQQTDAKAVHHDKLSYSRYLVLKAAAMACLPSSMHYTAALCSSFASASGMHQRGFEPGCLVNGVPLITQEH